MHTKAFGSKREITNWVLAKGRRRGDFSNQSSGNLIPRETTAHLNLFLVFALFLFPLWFCVGWLKWAEMGQFFEDNLWGHVAVEFR